MSAKSKTKNKNKKHTSNAIKKSGRAVSTRYTAKLDGASRGRSMATATTVLQNLNSLVTSGGLPLLARVRDMQANNPYVARASTIWPAYVIGAGIMPSPRIDDDGARVAVAELWWEWTDRADADERLDFYGLQSLVASEVYVGGEAFVIRTQGGFDAVPLALRVLPAEMLPYDNIGIAKNGNIIRAGIEFNAAGKRVAYHFYTQHPGDLTDMQRTSAWRQRIPAEDVCHVYEVKQAGQIRGISMIAPVVVRMHLLDRYDEAELDRQRCGALFVGAVTRSLDGDAETSPLEGITTHVNGENVTVSGRSETPTLAPGAMWDLEPGEDVKFSDPPSLQGAYEAFQARNLKAAASALDVPYHTLSSDLSEASFGSMRGGQLDYKRRIGAVQNNVVNFQLNRRVWEWWWQAAYLAGGVTSPDPDRAARAPIVDWQVPDWDWIDPLKDEQAKALKLENDTKSRREIVEAGGRPLEAVDAD